MFYTLFIGLQIILGAFAGFILLLAIWVLVTSWYNDMKRI